MNNETHEDRVKILEDAPDGSNSIDMYNMTYWEVSVDGYNMYHDGGLKKYYNTFHSDLDMRSLSDIQQLVDMQNEIDKWHKAYLTAMNEFDKKCKALNKLGFQFDEMKAILSEIRNTDDVEHYLFEMDGTIEELIND